MLKTDPKVRLTKSERAEVAKGLKLHNDSPIEALRWARQIAELTEGKSGFYGISFPRLLPYLTELANEQAKLALEDFVRRADINQLRTDIEHIFRYHPEPHLFKEALDDLIAEIEGGDKPLFHGSNSVLLWIVGEE